MVLAFVAGCGGGLDPILGSNNAGIAPTVTATFPAAAPAATNVPTNSRITATFSKAMLASSLSNTSFTLACPAGTPVAASVSYDAASQTATLTPTALLPLGSVCVATITTAAQDTQGFVLAANYSWSFTTTFDGVRPTVTFTIPTGGSSNVALNTRISATFSEDMLASTIIGSSFTLTNTTLGTAVAGSVSYSAASRSATFTPSTPLTLPANSTFTATITSAATDVAGNALAGNPATPTVAANFVWTFSTGAAADTTAPTVLFTVPANGAVGAATNTAVQASFSEAMNPASINASSFTLRNATLGTAVTGSVSYSVSGRTAIFTPSTPTTLPANTSFTATITAAATDLAGNALSGNTVVVPNPGSHVWSFNTGLTADATAPTVTAVNPAAGSTNQCLTSGVNATFSKAMDAATINAATFTVTDAGVAVPGVVSYDAPSRVASFTPSSATGFAQSRSFVVTVKSGATGVKDVAGNALAADRTWTFATGTAACSASVNLGTAASYGTFGGGAGITNQGVNTVIGGNIGTTAACTAVTGLHDAANVYTQTPLNVGSVNGSINCGPPAPGTTNTLALATQARADALAAYTALAAMPPGSDPGAGQLGGLVLAPAVYTAAGGTFDITSGDLTLDGQNNPNAMWVFQSASAVTVGLPATPRRVLLINGAQARNVFWQVGSAARIEVGSTMVGTIIAPAGVTISTADQTIQTTLIGRAIGLTASVTMVNTTIVAP